MQAYSACEPGEDAGAVLAPIVKARNLSHMVPTKVLEHPDTKQALRVCVDACSLYAAVRLQTRTLLACVCRFVHTYRRVYANVWSTQMPRSNLSPNKTPKYSHAINLLVTQAICQSHKQSVGHTNNLSVTQTV